MLTTAWRALGATTPYNGVPHLSGKWDTGRLDYIQEHGILSNLDEAAKLAKEQAMCTFYVGKNLIILLRSPEIVYEFKMRQQGHIEPAVPYWNCLPGSAVITDSEYGKKLRNLYHATVGTTTAIASLAPSITEIIDEKMQYLQEKNEIDISNPATYFRNLALTLALRLFMGINVSDSEEDHAMLTYISQLLAGPFPDQGMHLLGLKDLDAKDLDKVKQYKEEMQKSLQKLLLDKQGYKIKSGSNLLRQIWELAKQKNHDDALTVENLFPDAFFFLAGGLIVTTGDSLPIILQLLCHNPEIKNTLIDKIRNPNPEDKISAEAYLDQIIDEAFRINPPVSVIPTKPAKEAFEMNGITIQKGDRVLVSPYISHHNPEIWLSPEKFIPERFSPENKQKIPKGAYIPFGLGARDCIGRNYGLKVIKTYLKTLFADFDVTLSFPQKESTFELVGPTVVISDDAQFHFTRHSTAENRSTHRPF